jgi:biotin carboxylase
MRSALGEFRVSGKGVQTTAAYLAKVLDDDRFANAKHDTGLLNDFTA